MKIIKAIKTFLLFTLLIKLIKIIRNFFQPEIVEVTFKIEDNHVHYTYNKIKKIRDNNI